MSTSIYFKGFGASVCSVSIGRVMINLRGRLATNPRNFSWDMENIFVPIPFGCILYETSDGSWLFVGDAQTKEELLATLTLRPRTYMFGSLETLFNAPKGIDQQLGVSPQVWDVYDITPYTLQFAKSPKDEWARYFQFPQIGTGNHRIFLVIKDYSYLKEEEEMNGCVDVENDGMIEVEPVDDAVLYEIHEIAEEFINLEAQNA